MAVALLGEADRTEPVAAGLRAMDVEVVPSSVDAVDPAALAVAVASPDTETVRRANDRLTDTWAAVEFGGFGGVALEDVEGAIAGFGPEGPCYRCLGLRVAASTPEAAEPPDAVPAMTARYAGAVAGWLLGGEGNRDGLVGTVHQLDGRRRRLLPVPGCDCHSEVDRSEILFAHRERPLETVLDAMERGLDEHTGIVTEVGERASHPAPYYLATLAETEGFSDVSAAGMAAGVDLDWSAAFVRAMGEALERYCAGAYRVEGLPESPPGSPVALERFALADESADPTGRWWPARSLAGESVALPAEAVTFPTPPGSDVTAITTGLGLGSSLVEATLRGLLETVERDACMLAWYSTFDPVALETDDDPIATWRRRVRGEGLEVSLRLVTQDVDVPVVTGVVHRRGREGEPLVEAPGVGPDDWPSFAVGSAAALDPVEAAERAIAEAVQNWMELEAMGRERADAEQGNIATFGGFPRAARSLLAFEHRVAADRIAPEGIPAGTAAVETVADHLHAADMEAYVARTTTRDVARLGLEAVRVVIPEAQPLVHDGEPVSDRLRTVPRDLGFRPRLDRGPHPYP